MKISYKYYHFIEYKLLYYQKIVKISLIIIDNSTSTIFKICCKQGYEWKK